MHETAQDLETLQQQLDASITRAGDFLRSSLQMPERSLNARQLARHLQGIRNLAFATVTSRSEPRVAPVGSFLYRGRFYIPTVATAARTRQAVKNPAVSLTYYEGSDMAIIVHGRAVSIAPDNPEFEALANLHRELSGQSVLDWGEGVYLRVDADLFYTFARFIEQFGE